MIRAYALRLLCSIVLAFLLHPASINFAASDGIVVTMTPLSIGPGVDADKEAVSAIIQTRLTQSKTVTLIDRKHTSDALKELKLAQQGMLTPDSARQLCGTLGARYFCSGRINKTRERTVASVMVFDIETTLIKATYKTVGQNNHIVSSSWWLATQVERIIADCEREHAARKIKAKPTPKKQNRIK